jgi:hypothetical protein
MAKEKRRPHRSSLTIHIMSEGPNDIEVVITRELTGRIPPADNPGEDEPPKNNNNDGPDGRH